jgi:hypothetical protein
MKVIAVTPAGRPRYLELLAERLLRQAGRRHLLPASRFFWALCGKSRSKQDKRDLVLAGGHQQCDLLLAAIIPM